MVSQIEIDLLRQPYQPAEEAPPPPYTLSIPVPQHNTRESGTPARPLPRLSHSPSAFAWPQQNTPPRRRTGKATINDLPLLTLHYILSCTLDPARTKSRFYADKEEEVTRRKWAMWRGLRGVNRRFYSVSTSILRTIYHPSYVACLHSVLPVASTDAFPQGRAAWSPIGAPDQSPELQTIPTRKSPFADRTRETALFDRWMGVRIGTELRKCESELTEDGDGEDELLKRLQPAARIEDLLTTLPPTLVFIAQQDDRSAPLPAIDLISLPLDHAHLGVSISPGWAQLYLYSLSIGISGQGRGRRQLVVEVRRERTAEETVQRFWNALEALNRGRLAWGERVE